MDFGWPETVSVASTGLRAVGLAISQSVSPHAIKLGSAYSQLDGGRRCVQKSRVEFIEGLKAELREKSADDLLNFKSVESTARPNQRDQSMGTLRSPSGRTSRHRRLALRRPPLRSGFLQANLRWRPVPLCSVSIPFCRSPQTKISLLRNFQSALIVTVLQKKMLGW